MFIRKKGNCFYMVESYRHGNKVRQRILASLGRSGDIEKTIAANQNTIEIFRRMKERAKPYQEYFDDRLRRFRDRAYAAKKNISRLQALGVVLQICSREDNLGTTKDGVLPKSADLPKVGVTIENVVPETSRRRDNLGTTGQGEAGL